MLERSKLMIIFQAVTVIVKKKGVHVWPLIGVQLLIHRDRTPRDDTGIITFVLVRVGHLSSV